MTEHDPAPHGYPDPLGWNTWDVARHNAWHHLPDGPRITFGVAVDDRVDLAATWRDETTSLGPHAVDGRYAATSWSVDGTEVSLEVATTTDELTAVVRQRTGPDTRAVVVVVDGTVTETPDGCFSVTAGVTRWTFTIHGAFERHGSDAFVLLDAETVVECRPEAATAAGTADSAESTVARVAAARTHAETREAATGGWLEDAGQAMSRAVTWNVVYAPDLRRVLVPTSRDFVSAERQGFYGTWAIHAWDSFFTALAASAFDRRLGTTIVRQVLETAEPSGMIPNRVSDDKGVTRDRSQPPVGAITVLEQYHWSAWNPTHRPLDPLREAFDPLLRWHRWWTANRIGPFGVLTWGSDRIADDPESGTTDRAKRESGLDDSPMYDEAVISSPANTLDIADVGLNALHIADARALAEMARLLGRDGEARELAAEAERNSERFESVFWSETDGLYLNRRSDGEFSHSISPTHLYPLLAGIPGRERARAIAERLLQPGILGGEPPLPSVSRDDSGFDSTYWRGRIWAPLAYLGISGLRRYGLDDLASPMVRSLTRLFLHEWHERSSVRENYPARIGEDVTELSARSDALMAWGGLIARLGISEVVRADTHGWSFPDAGARASVSGIDLADGVLTVDRTEATTGGADTVRTRLLPHPLPGSGGPSPGAGHRPLANERSAGSEILESIVE
ncbi:amylo-alpha-1,6-glucosidase [Rathayibacter sp. CAU 1779]